MTEGADQDPVEEGIATGDDGGPPGERLRAVREEAGLSRQQLAAALLMDPGILAALEVDDYPALGAAVYVKGYIRRVAEHLDVDPEPLVAAFERHGGDMTPPLMTDIRPREPVEASSRMVGMLTLLVVIAALGLTAAWWMTRPQEAAEPAPTQVQEPTRTEDRPGSAATATQPSVSSDPGQTVVEDPEPTTDSAGDQASGEPPDDPAARDEEPAATADGAAQPTEAGSETVAGVQLTLSFDERSWVQVEDASGVRLAYELFRAGDRIDLQGMPPLTVYLGNAPAVQLESAGEDRDLTPFTRRDNTARFRIDEGGRPVR